jgi:hypothetical protein
MRNDDATAALAEAERREATVRAGVRWPTRIFAVWGIVTLVVEPAFAFFADRPWMLVLPMAVVMIFVAWVAVYANRQRVYGHGFSRRYTMLTMIWTALHFGYIWLVTVGGFRSLPYILIGAAAVAAPMFIGVYVESRRR